MAAKGEKNEEKTQGSTAPELKLKRVMEREAGKTFAQIARENSVPYTARAVIVGALRPIKLVEQFRQRIFFLRARAIAAFVPVFDRILLIALEFF